MTTPTAGIARLEAKIDDLNKGQSAILERLASIEATHKAEATERATIHSFTQSALDALQKQIDEEKVSRQEAIKAEAQARRLEREADLVMRRWIIGLAVSGFLFPIVVGLLFLLVNGHT
jgi:hypothetical protein